MPSYIFTPLAARDGETVSIVDPSGTEVETAEAENGAVTVTLPRIQGMYEAVTARGRTPGAEVQPEPETAASVVVADLADEPDGAPGSLWVVSDDPAPSAAAVEPVEAADDAEWGGYWVMDFGVVNLAGTAAPAYPDGDTDWEGDYQLVASPGSDAADADQLDGGVYGTVASGNYRLAKYARYIGSDPVPSYSIPLSALPAGALAYITELPAEVTVVTPPAGGGATGGSLRWWDADGEQWVAFPTA